VATRSGRRKNLGLSALLVLPVITATACGARTRVDLEGDPPRNSPDGGVPVADPCNGVDDDGDHLVDEDAPLLTCGIGACRVERPSCVSGAPRECQPLEPSPETCNGVDDDCNGETDDDVPMALESGPITVRADEGRTADDCTTCAWAWYPKLIAPADELVVAWYLGIYGDREQPSAFARGLSWDGEPITPITSLGPSIWLQDLTRGWTGSRGALFTFFERSARRDLPSFAFVDERLEASPPVRLDACGGGTFAYAATPVLPGLVTCWNLSTTKLQLFAVDDETRSVRAHHEHDVDLPGTAYPIVSEHVVGAVRNGQRLVVVNPAFPIQGGGSYLWALSVDGGGGAVGGPLLSRLPDEITWQLDALFPTVDGFVLFLRGVRGSEEALSGWYTIPLGPDGVPSGEMRHYDEDLPTVGALEVIPLGSGYALASGGAGSLVVERLDETGAPLERFVEPREAYPEPSLLFSHGKLFVAVTDVPETDLPNPISVYRFGCIR
jgi:hypothetical protein